ncbi:hypothetical protein DVH24_036023 [Malus domestica]|uniref:Uncharacterized protein n=1 Tax=Malus domestica TaxID=3750 RepID=A0A498JQD4_MALDO|nr:hypothetical protein DVH24_036023 [Malus domestica]
MCGARELLGELQMSGHGAVDAQVSIRLFGSSLASGSVGTSKVSEKKARALPGWVTHWEVAREFPETKP